MVQGYHNWREERIRRAPDPFLEDAVDAPAGAASAAPPPPSTPPPAPPAETKNEKKEGGGK